MKKSVKSSAKKPTFGLAGAALADQALENLTKIDHLVILMVENRSFDHMLGS